MTKLRMLLGFFLFLFAAIILRLFYLQVINPISSADYLATRRIKPERGKIFDRNNQPLVANQAKYQLYLEPQKMKDAEILKIKLARELQVDEASIEAKIDKT